MLALGVAIDFGFRTLFIVAAVVYLAAASLLVVFNDDGAQRAGSAGA
jgi:hypothetical protein